ncbi:MAG: hypothetical protein Q9218_004922 [Villophora microphyllina]
MFDLVTKPEINMAFVHFLKLPLEIRQHVYSSYFAALDLTYPQFSPSALVVSSRQLREEALPFYSQNAHFNFTGTKSMVDFLSVINHETLCNLRHISVRGYSLLCYPNNAEHRGVTTYTFDNVLPLFPGLQLSSLRVDDPFHVSGYCADGWASNATYYSVESLIKSQGFKKLIYTVEHDRFLKAVSFRGSGLAEETQRWVNYTKTSGRQPQPSTWDAMIKERDGASPGASVEMYRLLDGGKHRIPLKTEFETIQQAAEIIDEDGDREEVVVDGQIEIIIRRGEGARYIQEGVQVNEHAQTLSDLFKEVTWKGILKNKFYIDGKDDPTSLL